MIPHPYEGKQLGCTDQAPPTTHTPFQLSRALDAMIAAQEATDDPKAAQRVFRTFPDNLKLEFNYSFWRYTTREGSRGVKV